MSPTASPQPAPTPAKTAGGTGRSPGTAATLKPHRAASVTAAHTPPATAAVAVTHPTAASGPPRGGPGGTTTSSSAKAVRANRVMVHPHVRGERISGRRSAYPRGGRTWEAGAEKWKRPGRGVIAAGRRLHLPFAGGRYTQHLARGMPGGGENVRGSSDRLVRNVGTAIAIEKFCSIQGAP